MKKKEEIIKCKNIRHLHLFPKCFISSLDWNMLSHTLSKFRKISFEANSYIHTKIV